MKVSKPSDFTEANKKSRKKPVHKQLAALCLRSGDAGPEVLLVTSSRGRWILPKGWPMDDCADHEAALVEAWEEAGVRKGKAERKAVGTFETVKTRAGRDEPSIVKVYSIKVSKTKKKYPEVEERDRKWVPLGRAAKVVDDKGLARFLKNYAKSA